MHKAVCSNCGRDCEVPFRPSGDKPVFCSDCFDKNRGGGSRGSDKRNLRMYEAVCDKCGNKCEVPFQPTSGKPIYCSQCFEKKSGARDGGKSEQFKEQFEMLNAKLDEILKMITPTPVAPEKVAKKVVKKTAAKKK